MKRRNLLRHLERHGCALLREGRNHTVYTNRGEGKSSTIPRHREINDFLARKVCRDLEVPEPQSCPALTRMPFIQFYQSGEVVLKIINCVLLDLMLFKEPVELIAGANAEQTSELIFAQALLAVGFES